MKSGFYIHCFDEWKSESGTRCCRGNMQFLRLMPDDPFSGMQVWISSQVDWRLKANFYAPCYVSSKEAYRIAWRVKRLFDRAMVETQRLNQGHQKNAAKA